MSLFNSLANGASALNAQGYALQLTGKNLANVNNAKYARERIVFGTGGMTQTSLGTVTFDLDAQAVSQIRDAFLDQQVVREGSTTAALSTEQSALQSAEAALGETVSSSSTTADTTSGAGLASQLTGLFNSFSSLAASPADTGVRQTLLQNAATLSDSLNQTDSGLAQVQTDLNTRIQSDAGGINTLLTTISDLNAQIARLENGKPGSAVDLRDQRQSALEDLGAKISFDTSPATSGGQLQITSTDVNGNSVVLVDGANVVNTVAFDGTNLTAGGFALSLASGSIKGALDARDGTIQSFRASLNALSRQVVTAVNTAYNPAGATGNFFAAAGTTAGTIALDPALTSRNLQAGAGVFAGDNTVALAVAGLASKTFSTAAGDTIDGSLTQFLSGAVSAFGQAQANVNSRVENQTSVENLVRSQRDSVSGVDLNEETTNLMKYQRAFQASSRFVNIVDNLLGTLVQLGT